jgi:hypothetical protein
VDENYCDAVDNYEDDDDDSVIMWWHSLYKFGNLASYVRQKVMLYFIIAS